METNRKGGIRERVRRTSPVVVVVVFAVLRRGRKRTTKKRSCPTGAGSVERESKNMADVEGVPLPAELDDLGDGNGGYVSLVEFDVVVDLAWIMITAFLGLLGHVGLALREVGMMGYTMKEVSDALAKNVLVVATSVFAWWSVGYAFAFGRGSADWFIGTQFFFLASTRSCPFEDEDLCVYSRFPSGPTYAFFLQQWVYASIVATITTSTIAKRCSYMMHAVYTFALIGVIYPVVVHWMWSGSGWLSAFFDPRNTWGRFYSGVVDFAGSGVVYMTAGAAAMVGCFILGPLKPEKNAGRISPMNSLALASTGTFLLWVCFYGLASGRTLGLSNGFARVAEKVAVMVTLAAGGGGIGGIALQQLLSISPKYEPSGTLVLNSVLGALVAVQAGASVIEPYAAFAIGGFAAPTYLASSALLDFVHLSDPLGNVAVFFFCGAYGLVVAGLLGTTMNTTASYPEGQNCGWFYSGCNWKQFVTNIVGAVMVAGWTLLTSLGVFLAIKWMQSCSERRDTSVSSHAQDGAQAYPQVEPSWKFWKRKHNAPVVEDSTAAVPSALD